MAEFVAIYGRRRVVEYGGKGDGLLKAQLKSFYESMVRQGMETDHCPRDWMEAFFMLSLALQKADDGSRQLVFLDELPWMDTPRSFFVTALENFWNGWACHRANFMLVVCGSANSWILNRLVNNHGGLYGRLTYQMKLSPFSLGECEEYYESRGIALSRYDMVQSYMIMGGVPYYMGYMRRQKSLSQNIDDMFFTRGAQLRDEFDRLFQSVFDNPDRVKDVVVYLSSRNSGFTREITHYRIKIFNLYTQSRPNKSLVYTLSMTSFRRSS